MARRKVRHMPVTDEAGRLVGIVALADLFTALGKAKPKESKALGAALLAFFGSLTARPAVRDEVVPAAPAKSKPAPETATGKKVVAKPAKTARPKKRARSAR
jgi:CBS-domain-containing membrane protein